MMPNPWMPVLTLACVLAGGAVGQREDVTAACEVGRPAHSAVGTPAHSAVGRPAHSAACEVGRPAHSAVGTPAHSAKPEAAGHGPKLTREKLTVAAHNPQVGQEKPKVGGHWGEEAVGFRWEEDDSRDARWNQMDIGPFLASALPAPGGMIGKALSVRVGDGGTHAVSYDLRHMNLRCGWSGGFLSFPAARYGINAPPSIAGEVAFTVPAGPGWENAACKYQGLYLHGPRVVLAYTVDGVRVLDSPWLETHGDVVAFTRSLQLDPAASHLTLRVADAQVPVALCGESRYAVLHREEGQPVRLQITPHQESLRIKFVLFQATDGSQPANAPLAEAQQSLVRASPAPEDLTKLTAPGPQQWTERLVTHGRLGHEDGPYAIDTITIPFANPYKALFFVGGHDFFSTPGKAALCTVHGDVWLVDGIDAELNPIHWQRFATGLFQPLGLKIVNDRVYVLGRDQITRLEDRNHDGEADYYECFNNDANTSPGGHDYSTCLETDSAGNFYYISHQGVHRISADGGSYETIATGMRNPNGLCVGPDGTITAAPQEGEWTPGSCVFEVTEGGYFGFGGPRFTEYRPRGYDPPICWVPRLVDNSTGGQVWVTSDRWGPLAGQLLNLSYGQCRLLLTLIEPRSYDLPSNWPVVGGARQGRVESREIPPSARFLQGGSVTLPLIFDSGIMRGRFSPHDGQLYVSGLRGWTTAAVQDGCFQRVRYTGRPVYLPAAVRTLANGIALSFSVPLESSIAQDPDSYYAEQWNYRYSKNYGSADYKVSDPAVEGHDEVRIQSATLLDPVTIFLEMENVQPVMQMAIHYAVEAADGTPMRGVYHHTINVVPDIRIDPARLVRGPGQGALAGQLEEHRAPGLLWRFSAIDGRDAASATSGERRDLADVRTGRLAALFVPAGQPATAFLRPGAFQAVADGYLYVPLRGRYTFRLEGRGEVSLRINDQPVLHGQGETLADIPRRTVPLSRGYNRLNIHYRSPRHGDAQLRLLWSGDDFATEPVPPTVLWHNGDDEEAVRFAALHEGRELFATLRCHKCHALARSVTATDSSVTDTSTFQDSAASRMPELDLDAPDLSGLGRRLKPAWVAQWLADPHSLRRHVDMPQVLDPLVTTRRQQAADLAAYLCARENADKSAGTESDDQVLALGSVSRGGSLYEDLSCAACHGWQPPDEEDDYDRISLTLVAEKYDLGSLAEYLSDPLAHYAAGRMPHYRLNEVQRADLAGFLIDAAQGELDPWTRQLRGDADRGRRLFQNKQCGACHAGPEQQGPSSSFVRALRQADSKPGCLGEDSQHAGPRYALTADEREALVQFFQTDGSSLAQRCDVEAAQRAVRRLRCIACHDRDSHRTWRPIVVAEEGSGRVPDPTPNLTWAGEKLRSDWMLQLFEGTMDQPVRPWLKVHMPAFPAYAETLATGLAHQHGRSTVRPARSTFNRQLANLGRQLVQKTALDCRQCHGIGAIQPQGDDQTLIALGINFAHVRQRLQPDFFHRFVLDPPRFDVSTKMPKLSADGRTTKVDAFLNGDARGQFEAVWHYIEHLDRIEGSALEYWEQASQMKQARSRRVNRNDLVDRTGLDAAAP